MQAYPIPILCQSACTQALAHTYPDPHVLQAASEAVPLSTDVFCPNPVGVVPIGVEYVDDDAVTGNTRRRELQAPSGSRVDDDVRTGVCLGQFRGLGRSYLESVVGLCGWVHGCACLWECQCMHVEF